MSLPFRVACAAALLFASVASPARSQSRTTSGAELERRAAALATAGKLNEAGEAYQKAADAYKAAGDLERQTNALRKSAEVYEQVADQLLGTTKSAPPAPARAAAPAPAPAARPTTAPAPAAGTTRTPAAAPGAQLEVGLYNCHGWYVYDAVVRRIEFKDASNYVFYTLNDKEKLAGRYQFNAATGKLSWLSGPLKGTHDGEYEPDTITRGMRLTVWESKNSAFICYRTGG